jgi:DNA-binding response OmpR family regulator
MMTRRRILWADDQIEELRSQILFLEGRGYDVEGVSNGDDAIDLFKKRSFDAVLLDESMPGKGGLETLAHIRDVDANVPVIMITKNEAEDFMDKALGRRIDDYLVKPVNPTQVLMALKKALDEGRLRNQQTTQDYLQSFAELARLRMEARDWRAWRDIYEKMVAWELQLQRLTDPGLAESHMEQAKDANAQFSRFVEQNYGAWIDGDDAPILSHQVVENYVVPHLKNGRRVFFFVIDCMRLDQWMLLEEELTSLYQIQRETYYGILPTATPFSRNAIFAGLLPAQIAKQFPQYWRGTAKEERSKNAFESELLGEQLKRLGYGELRHKYYKTFNSNDVESMRKQLPSLRDVHLVAGVINFLDILAHGRSQNDLLRELAPDDASFRSVMQSWFAHSSLLEMLRELALQDDVAVVITTDHGAIQVRRSALVKANRDASTNVRYKYGDNLNVDPKEAFIMKDPRRFGLPQDSPIQNYICAKEANYFVYPTNFHDYERQYRDSFQHGGISLEEMIIPAVSLLPR